MGATLVSLVLARWTHLPDRQFRILLRMAHTALDQPNGDRPARLYFGGHDLLAMTLRSPYPLGDDKEDMKARATIHRHVRSAIRELVADGAVRRHGTSHTGHQQEYWVLPSAGPQETYGAGPQKTYTQVRKRPARAGPQKTYQGTTTGTTQELSQEIDTSLDTDSKVVGEPEAVGFDLFNGDKERRRQAAALDEWIREQEANGIDVTTAAIEETQP